MGIGNIKTKTEGRKVRGSPLWVTGSLSTHNTLKSWVMLLRTVCGKRGSSHVSTGSLPSLIPGQGTSLTLGCQAPHPSRSVHVQGQFWHEGYEDTRGVKTWGVWSTQEWSPSPAAMAVRTSGLRGWGGQGQEASSTGNHIPRPSRI